MTDPNTTTAPAPVPTTGNTSNAKANDKSPLDALEALLNDAKAKAASPAKGAKATDTQTAQAQAAADDEAVKKQELAKLAEQKKQEDQVNIKAQLANMKEELAHSPQQKAREEQDQAQKTSQADKDQTREEYQIRQLAHKKI